MHIVTTNLGSQVRKKDPNVMVDLDVFAGDFKSLLTGIFELFDALSKRSDKVLPQQAELDVQVGVKVLEVAIDNISPQEWSRVV